MSRAETAAKMFAGFGLAFLGGSLLWVGVTRGQGATRVSGEYVPTVITAPPAHRTPPIIRTLERKPVKTTGRTAGAPLAETARPLPKPTISVERYKNCTELRKVHPGGVPYGHPAYEVRHDRDRDNWACENFGGPITPSPSASASVSRTPTPSTSPAAPASSPPPSPSPPVIDPPVDGEGSLTTF
jgi:hypothetical protein